MELDSFKLTPSRIQAISNSPAAPIAFPARLSIHNEIALLANMLDAGAATRGAQ